MLDGSDTPQLRLTSALYHQCFQNEDTEVTLIQGQKTTKSMASNQISPNKDFSYPFMGSPCSFSEPGSYVTYVIIS